MSLWTPGGEHEVPREPARPSPSDPASGAEPAADPTSGLTSEQLLSVLSPEDQERLRSLPPEERARVEENIREQIGQMAEVQAQMAATPAAVVVANHAMGLYELATIHLRQSPPNLEQATVAIDAFAALVESLQGRLGADEPTLTDALAQIRLAFVQIKAATEGSTGDAPPTGSDAP